MSCPDIEALERYLCAPEEDASRLVLVEHLAVCADCSSRLEDLRENRRIEPPVRRLLAAALGYTELPARIGAYRVLRELGRGGMSVVYEAEQQYPARRVAVKVLHPRAAGGPNAAHFLRREATALARLQHASIASIFEAGYTPEGRAFLAMELVNGQPLLTYAHQAALSLRQCVALFATVCESVAYAHQRGVIHRDLKPSNVLVQPDGIPKVLDFGLARILDLEHDDSQSSLASISGLGRVFGTLPYMSPEHVGSPGGPRREVDVRSDVYSLGVMLYELLTGRLPYPIERTNLAHSARVICEQAPVRPSAIRGELRGDLETILLKALDKAPPQRYPSAAELAQDLRRFLDNEPIAARPPGTLYLLRKFAARNRTLVASVIVSLAALLGVTAAAVGQAYVATRERDSARRRLELARHLANYLLFGLDQQIIGVEGTQAIQRHLAEETYVFCKRIADERPDDPMQHATLWAVLRRLVMLSLEDGNRTRAEVLADHLDGLVERTAAQHPGDPRVQSERMRVSQTLAKVTAAAGDAAAAEAHTQRAFELAREVSDWYERHTDLEDPNVWVVPDTGPDAGAAPIHLRARTDWTLALMGAAERAVDAGDLETAQGHCEEALRLVEDSMQRDPTLDPIYRRDLSDHAPMAGPILLRNGSRKYYELSRARIQAALERIAELQSESEDPDP